MGEPAKLGEITEAHFDAAFGLNVWLAELEDRRIRVNVLTPGQEKPACAAMPGKKCSNDL